MKKFFIGLLAVMFFAGMAYAEAPDMDFSGMINTRGTYISNDSGVSDDPGEYMKYDMEFDADLKIKPNDTSFVFLNMEIHDEDFADPGEDNLDDNIEFKRAFLYDLNPVGVGALRHSASS